MSQGTQMDAFDDFIASVSSFQYLTEAVIILSAVLIAAIAILIYRYHLNKQRRAKQDAEYYNQPEYQNQAPQPEPQYVNVPPQQQRTNVPPQQPQQPQQPGPQPSNAYPGSIVMIGNYILYNDRIQVSPRKCIFYDEITSIRYESNYSSRVIITIGHAWELSLTAQDQTLKLYNSIMSIMNSEMIRQQMGRKKHMLR